MKKFILSFAALLVAGFASAQADTTKFGVKAGVQFTSFDADGEWSNRTGFFVGGLADIPVAGNFHVQPEIMFSQEGAEADNAGTESEFSISYLRIPIMAKYYVIQGLSLQAGPEIAFKVGTADEDVDAIISSTDFALGAGIGYELPIGLMFDLRYNLGLTDIHELDEAELKNTGIQLGIGYRF